MYLFLHFTSSYFSSSFNSTLVHFFCNISFLLCSLFQMSGPIKEKDGRVRHFKGVGETVPQDTSLGNSLCKLNSCYFSLTDELRWLTTVLMN